MKSISCIILLSLLAIFSNAQLIRQPVSNFTPREYGQDAPSYTYSITECTNGLIYVGTAYRVLQFDGETWRHINVRGGAAVTSVAAKNENVYLGCHGDFGLLRADEWGKHSYISLSENLPDDEKDFSAIRKIHFLNDTVVFQTEEKFFLVHNDEITIVKPKTSFHLSFVHNNTLYARERENGLLAFDGQKFNLVNGGELFEDFGLFAVLPFKTNSKLLVTLELGLWEWVNDEMIPITLEENLQALIDEAGLIGGMQLDDGNYALNSFRSGVIILGPELDFVANYSVNTGLLASEILDMTQDSHGNLWVATQKGASRIQYTSPFSTFNQSVGLYGSVQTVEKMSGKYLVGTTEGLFISEPDGLRVFSQQPQITSGVWSMQRTPRGIWIGTNNGLWLYNGTTYNQVDNQNTSGLLHIPEQDWLVAAGLNGFKVINERNGRVLLNLSNIRTDTYGIAYKKTNDNSFEVWMGSKTSGVWQINITKDLNYSHTVYSLEDGLPPDWVCAYQAEDDVVFATSDNGLLRFVSPEELHGLLNDESINVTDLKGYFDIIDFPKNSNDKAITAFHYDTPLSYAVLDYHVNEVSMRDSIPNDYLFRTLELGRVNVIRKVKNEVLIGGDDGLSVLRRIDKKDRPYPLPNLMIRSITIGSDSLIWYGDKQLERKVLEIPYSLNGIVVDLASSYFDNGFTASYSWRIKGDEENYLRWSSQNTVSLSNLREGEYELLMVAKNIHGDLSEELSILLRILPPWYRTWWAFTLYALLAIAIVYGLIQYNIRRLKEQNKKLEEIVKARTREVVEQKEHIEHILQDIQSSISYAQRIQQALLPSQEVMEEFFPKHFIVFYPRDVVSGDFYWATKVNEWAIITAADCTGHGVPGAFMSMLGISFLNDIVQKKEVVNAAQVLNQLRESVVDALKQTGKQNEQKDGMDMSIAAINLKTKECLWAGANNPLLILRKENGFENHQNLESKKVKIHTYENCQIKEIKADKMPVAIHTIMEKYTSHSIQLLPGDKIYLYSDGFPDQFGGPDHRKYMAKKFRELIAETSDLQIIEQGQKIDEAFNAWKVYKSADNDQIDDVTVLGIEI